MGCRIIILFTFIYFNFFFLAILCGLQDLSSPARDGTQALIMKEQCFSHWSVREFPVCFI